MYLERKEIKSMEINTERLYIRPFIKKDIDDIYDI